MFLTYPALPLYLSYSFKPDLFVSYPPLPLYLSYSFKPDLFFTYPVLPWYLSYSFKPGFFLSYPVIPWYLSYSFKPGFFLSYPVIPWYLSYSFIPGILSYLSCSTFVSFLFLYTWYIFLPILFYLDPFLVPLNLLTYSYLNFWTYPHNLRVAKLFISLNLMRVLSPLRELNFSVGFFKPNNNTSSDSGARNIRIYISALNNQNNNL